MLFTGIHQKRNRPSGRENPEGTSKPVRGTLVGGVVTARRIKINKNPYQYGCLYAKNLTKNKRVCNSEDSPNTAAATRGILCRKPPFEEYPEIRIVPGDWESCFFGTWIVQIALSELLGVPTSIEMGSRDAKLNLYAPEAPFDYPTNYAIYPTAFENAYKYGGDCSKANTNQNNNKKKNGNGDDDKEEENEPYEQCGHFSPEEWNGREKTIQDLVYNGDLDPLQDLGMLASESWYVPKYTANTYPSLLSYNNLQEDTPANKGIRQLLAEVFKRPTTWEDYCRVVSTNNCSLADSVAKRPPLTVEERSRMFVADQYTGYFRSTSKNNCTTTSTAQQPTNGNCTGHFTDWPCAWSSPVPSQLHYLNIPLSTDVPDVHGGYTYTQLQEIWRAANATRSHVIMFWWKPELFVREFQGTDYEFIQVTLPEATQACMDARLTNSNQCSPNLEDRISGPEGACGDPPKGLHTLISSTIYTQSFGGLFAGANKKPVAIHSPAYAMLGNYRFSELQLGEVFTLWQKNPDNPRQAICDWVAANMDYMESLIPRTYPRVPEPQPGFMDPLMDAAAAIGAIVVFLVITTMILVGENTNRLSIRYAQIEFLALLLVGALLVALGAILISVPASATSCIMEIWFINIGYTLLLVPLIVKVAAVNHVMNVGRMMKRIRIRRDLLFGLVTLISILVAIYLVCWTIFDPPTVFPEYELTNQLTKDGETIVKVVGICRSESWAWSYISVGWNALLLLATCIQAIQMRKIEMQGFNETPTLALMVYSSLMFVLLRGITYMLSSSISEYVLARCRSLIYSLDTAANIIIYFMPKLFAQDLRSVSGNMHISPSSFHSTAGEYYSSGRRLGGGQDSFYSGGGGSNVKSNNSNQSLGEDSTFVALEEIAAAQQQNSNSNKGGGGVQTKNVSFRPTTTTTTTTTTQSSIRSSGVRNSLATTVDSTIWDGDEGTPPPPAAAGTGEDNNDDIEQVPPPLLESYNDNNHHTVDFADAAVADVSEKRNDPSSTTLGRPPPPSSGVGVGSRSPSQSPQRGGRNRRRISFRGLRSSSMPQLPKDSPRSRPRSRQSAMKKNHHHQHQLRSSRHTPNNKQRDSRSSWIVVMRDSDIVELDKSSSSSSSSSNDDDDEAIARLSVEDEIEQLEAQNRSTLLREKEIQDRYLEQRIEMLEEEKTALIAANGRRIEALEGEKHMLLEANELQQKEIWELRARLFSHASATTTTGTHENQVEEEKSPLLGSNSNTRTEGVEEEEKRTLLEANELQQKDILELQNHLLAPSSSTTGETTGTNEVGEEEKTSLVEPTGLQKEVDDEEKRTLLEANELQPEKQLELHTAQLLADTSSTTGESTGAAHENQNYEAEKSSLDEVNNLAVEEETKQLLEANELQQKETGD